MIMIEIMINPARPPPMEPPIIEPRAITEKIDQKLVTLAAKAHIRKYTFMLLTLELCSYKLTCS